MGTYPFGYLLMPGDLVAGVWRLVVEYSRVAWTGIVVVTGIRIMLSVVSGGKKREGWILTPAPARNACDKSRIPPLSSRSIKRAGSKVNARGGLRRTFGGFPDLARDASKRREGQVLVTRDLE
jgi:hypothetical protein